MIDKIKFLSLPEDEIFTIKLSLEEAVTNAVKHGNKFDRNLRVRVRVQAEERYLSMEVEDEGEGYDVRSIPDPTRNENINKDSGRGVFLIKTLMDEVSFLKHGRLIRMKKKLRGRV